LWDVYVCLQKWRVFAFSFGEDSEESRHPSLTAMDLFLDPPSGVFSDHHYNLVIQAPIPGSDLLEMLSS
jgi:hypothetical protein